MNIGITLTNSHSEKIWGNGITQNVLNLYFLLKNISEFNIFLVDPKFNENDNIFLNDGIYLKQLDDLIDDLNILIVAGYNITEEQCIKLKKNKCKLVYYSCGSEYFFDMEIVLFDKKGIDRLLGYINFDEIWVLPHHYETNKFYFEILYKKPVKLLPFIWSSFFIDGIIKKYETKIKFNYKPNNIKNISIFEPNIDIVKYAMYPILICDKVYNENKSIINHLYVTNTDGIRNNKLFIDIMKRLNIVKEGVTTFEDRYIAPYFLGNYTDVVVTHQVYNSLNYLYLDVLYLNYPLVHNAHMIKDAGYYYDGFNVEMGKEKLLFALMEHDKNREEYEEKSKIILDSFLPTNEQNLKVYKKTILDLFK